MMRCCPLKVLCRAWLLSRVIDRQSRTSPDVYSVVQLVKCFSGRTPHTFIFLAEASLPKPFMNPFSFDVH